MEESVKFSKYIIQCFQSMIDSNSWSKIETLLKVTTNNLTYDDPGMFAKQLIRNSDHLLLQSTTVFWIINQVVWLSNHPQFYSSLEASTNLQKVILSASLLKQPKFSVELIECYIEFTNQLAYHVAKPSRPIRVTTFQMNHFNLLSIDIDGTFKSIEITTPKSQTNLLISNVRLLSYVVTEIIDLERTLLIRCTQCILNTFHNAHVRVKSRCLRYFTKLLSHVTALDAALQPTLVSIMEGIECFEKVIPLWLHHKLVKTDDIEHFATLANDFLGSQNIYKHFDDKQIQRAAQCCLNIIRAHQQLKVNAYDKIVTNAYKFVKTIATDGRDEILHQQIYQFAKESIEDDQLFGQNIALLSCSVLYQMKMSSDISSWALVDKKIIDIQCAGNVSNSIIIDHLQCLHAIIKNARFLEYSLAMHTQRRCYEDNKDSHIDQMILAKLRQANTHFLGRMPQRLFSDISALCSYVLKSFNVLLTTKFSPLIDTSALLLFANVAIAILSLSNAQDIDTYIQLQLLLLTLCPFIRESDLLFNHFHQAFEAETSRVLKIMETPFIASRPNDSWQEFALQSIVNINLTYMSSENKEIFLDIFVQIATNLNQPENLKQIISVLMNCVIQIDTYGIGDLEKFIEKVALNTRNHPVVSNALKLLYCLSSGKTYVMQTNKDDAYRYKIVCPICMANARQPCKNVGSLKHLFNDKTNGRFVRAFTTVYTVHTAPHIAYFKMFTSTEPKIRENMTFCLPAILNHLDLNLYENVADYWLNPIIDSEMNIRLWMIEHIHIISKQTNERMQKKCFEKLLACSKTYLISDHKSDQSSVLSLISSFATAAKITESVLIDCFRLTLYFCMCSKSMVSRQAAICANEMCTIFGLSPENILTWNKTEMFKFIISICVSNHLKDCIGLQKSLHSISQLFGYIDEKDFISKHYRTMLAILIPWQIKNEKCVGLIEEICDTIQKDLSSTMCSSFLSIYTHLNLYESTEINTKGLDYVMRSTDHSLYQLLKSDVKRTSAEILLFYHANPKFVMETFRLLLSNNGKISSENNFSTRKLVDYLTSRFLGVMCYFEQILTNENEKWLKREVILSIGEIMRFMGSEIITQFRFKLLAILRTALTITQPDLKDECAQVWKVFISTVDLMELGPLLSTIFVSLEPLSKTHKSAVDNILKHLIIDNGNILSTNIADLFFLQHIHVSDEIKSHVARYTDKTKKTFSENFMASMRYINHDNITVRIHGLRHLINVLVNNRKPLNQMIVGQQKLDVMIENLLNDLFICMKNKDSTLQVLAGRCLGELGAIEPSLLAPNYRPQQSFAKSIDSDEFAIHALTELCAAYQMQTDTKNLDNYSLAIQDILQMRKVCPQKKDNSKVWQAIPNRMKSLVEPLLTSSYIITHPLVRLKIHPIFGCKSATYEEWATTFASKAIDIIEEDSLRNLLRSFKPSMRSDMRILGMAMPYIILHAIQFGQPGDCREIVEEFHIIAECVLSPANSRSNDGNQHERHKTIKNIDFPAPVSNNFTNDTTTSNKAQESVAVQCIKLVFNQLDFLDRWVRSSQSDDKHYGKVRDFLKQFDKKIIATANYICHENARALMYLEAYIEENRKERFQSELSFLFQIYAELMDPDSLEGALNIKDTEPTVTEQIIKNSVQGRLHESTVCFERIMNVHGLIENTHCTKDMIQCYLGLDQPETAILLAEGLMKHLHYQNNDILVQNSAEPLWRLGRFDELEELIENSEFKNSPDWGIRCGKILLDFRKADACIFAKEINNSRLIILNDFRQMNDEHNSYHKGYPTAMKMHLVCEIEQAFSFVTRIGEQEISSDVSVAALKRLFDEWDARLQYLQPVARILEPVLCLRRLILTETIHIMRTSIKSDNVLGMHEKIINDYVGTLWIRSIELAREEGLHQQADLYILNAESHKPKNLFIEKAKLLRKKGDQTNSLKVLERGIEDITPSVSDRQLTGIEETSYAEAKFLLAFYNAESLNINTDLNVKYFKEAKEALVSEKVLVHFAQYLDKTLAAMSAPTSNEAYDAKASEYQVQIMCLYIESMVYGTKYIYQSMPRVLSIWFDFSAGHTNMTNRKNEDHLKRTINRMNQIADQYSDKLPAFAFFTAFSQLVSRICHPSLEVWNVLKTILVKLIKSFPQQSLWMILSVYKSSYASRVRRCTEVFSDPRLQQKPLQKLIQDFNAMAAEMIELTNKQLPAKQPQFSIGNIYPKLPALFAKPEFSRILLPIQKYMQPQLPALHQRNQPATSFNVFSHSEVYIHGMKDEFHVLPSLQRPRRVTFIGTDGQSYITMMKPDDDLRKDFRLMEFNAVVKQYLHQNSEARQRRLNIRTYAVLPLNEKCGILEWVSNLQAFRVIVNGYYKPRKLGLTSAEMKEAQTLGRATIEIKRQWFNRILVKCPPVFSEWFRERFTSPHNWYEARNAYVRTTAVMSIVGYILGLGDRHGENILFDANNGDTVHVDFNCLFNKGELFEVPEVVPFRLTHNMTHAMGPLGIEGAYRRCCEITMKIMQDQMPTLMSVLKPFVYDPLVSWSRQSKTDPRSERTDQQAMTNVQHIEQRLKGYVKINGTNSNMPLSTDGVVNHCIIEATDIDKLASMYIGWGAYL